MLWKLLTEEILNEFIASQRDHSCQKSLMHGRGSLKFFYLFKYELGPVWRFESIFNYQDTTYVWIRLQFVFSLVHYGLLIPRTSEVVVAFAYERFISHMSTLNYAKVYRGEVYPVWACGCVIPTGYEDLIYLSNNAFCLIVTAYEHHVLCNYQLFVFKQCLFESQINNKQSCL